MITTIQHINSTVSNLEEARAFFTDKLGVEGTPIRADSGERVEQIVEFSDLRMKNSNIIRGNGLQLIEYVSPKGPPIDPAAHNTGVAHVPFAVDGVQSTRDEWTSNGVPFIHPPLWARAAALKGGHRLFPRSRRYHY